MVSIFNSVSNLVNSAIKINSTLVNQDSNNCIKSDKLPISCKYFLTLLDIKEDKDINDFFSYINDETRTIDFPFVKDEQVNYSIMLEPEQFYNIELNDDTNIKYISNNIDTFIDIVNESNGKIIFILDINYLLNFLIKFNNDSKPNHLIDMILFKLKNSSKISEIYILDKQSLIKNNSNLLYTQLEMIIGKTINELKLDEKKVVVYKNIDESLEENVYWNILDPETKITSHIGKIKSPFDNSDFNLMIINEKTYFVKQINILDYIDKNLYNLNDSPGIIINPIDRLFI